jgi:hypothetical protein
MWFNSAYTSEVAGMVTINHLIQRRYLQSPDFHMIDLIEIQVPLHYGYFRYFHEEKGVYDLAFNESMAALLEHEQTVATEQFAG